MRNESTEDAFAKIIKNDMKVDINTLCSFPGQSVQGDVSFLLSRDLLNANNISTSYSIVINDDTIDITVRDIYSINAIANPTDYFPIAIEDKMVFRLNKQGDEYVPITPLEAQVNVYDADVFVEDHEDDEYKEPLAFRILKKITSIDWKNDEVENNKI